MSNKIENLRRQIAAEQEVMRKCAHNFNDPVYDAETKIEWVGSGVMEYAGSDTREGVVSKKVTKDRWSRTCLKCGKVEYTYKLKPVITKHVPKFDNQ